MADSRSSLWPVLLKIGAVAGVVVLVLMVLTSDWMNHWYYGGGEELESIGVENPPSPKSFAPVEVVSRPPLVTGFQTMSAADASKEFLDEELVLAVEINGEARAWPLNVMTGPEREVFNDELGGRSIAATW